MFPHGQGVPTRPSTLHPPRPSTPQVHLITMASHPFECHYRPPRPHYQANTTATSKGETEKPCKIYAELKEITIFLPGRIALFPAPGGGGDGGHGGRGAGTTLRPWATLGAEWSIGR